MKNMIIKTTMMKFEKDANRTGRTIQKEALIDSNDEWMKKGMPSVCITHKSI